MCQGRKPPRRRRPLGSGLCLATQIVHCLPLRAGRSDGDALLPRRARCPRAAPAGCSKCKWTEERTSVGRLIFKTAAHLVCRFKTAYSMSCDV
eukprot:6102751-Prymnesium_polylepis.1